MTRPPGLGGPSGGLRTTCQLLPQNSSLRAQLLFHSLRVCCGRCIKAGAIDDISQLLVGLMVYLEPSD